MLINSAQVISDAFNVSVCEDDVIQKYLVMMAIVLITGVGTTLPFTAAAADNGVVLLGSTEYEDEDDEDEGGDTHESVRLNIVAFEIRDKDFTFESLITGTYAQLFQEFEGKADVIFLNRTPVIRDGDVLNIQEDALRMVGDQLANDGLNCTFSFSNLSDSDSDFYTISGMCNLMYSYEGGTRKVRTIVKRAILSEANYGVNAWISIYEDKEAGVILYADVDPG